MPTRDERRAEAVKHLALMKGAFAKEAQATIDAAVVYEDGDALALELPEPTAEATETQVTSDFTTTALRRAQGKTAIVDPVSYTRPGGAYEDGSFGPEQILCSESNLYPVLCGMKSVYHDQNRSYMCGMLLTSRAMYLPNVVFIREGEIREASVIAVPEPNRERALENHRSERECHRLPGGPHRNPAQHRDCQRNRNAHRERLRMRTPRLPTRPSHRAFPAMDRRSPWRHQNHRVRRAARKL